jgi:hypothetical protein
VIEQFYSRQFIICPQRLTHKASHETTLIVELLSLNDVGSSGIDGARETITSRGTWSSKAEGDIHISAILILSIVGFKNVGYCGCQLVVGASR